MKRKSIFNFVLNNIKYNDFNVICNAHQLSEKLASKLGFTSQIGNIIHNCILSIDSSGEKEQDAIKIFNKIKESIWLH